MWGRIMIITILTVVNIILIGVLTKGMFSISERLSKLEDFIIENQSSLSKESPKEDGVGLTLINKFDKIQKDDEKQLELFKTMRNAQNKPTPILNQNSLSSDTFDTGGDLIPVNSTKEELEVLRMFYEK